ncbi:UDP-N-acetylmuramoyl-L-alanyl-D-glutamate synthetase, partial [Candidatus Endoriftia persephone str. Guaymas]|nr:UDP-N-acetylmuramoyl-L-alanyl-D-glutamate synthetase [Candidatus Endoriftia persephone str. Guaymas]
LRAKVAVVLNIAADHMDRYVSLDDYIAAKAVVYRNAEQRVVNRDDPRVVAMVADLDNTLGFTLGEPEGEDFGVRRVAG